MASSAAGFHKFDVLHFLERCSALSIYRWSENERIQDPQTPLRAKETNCGDDARKSEWSERAQVLALRCGMGYMWDTRSQAADVRWVNPFMGRMIVCRDCAFCTSTQNVEEGSMIRLQNSD